jgi:hypothetical protein
MLSGLFCLQLLFKTLFSFIKSAGTCVFKHSNILEKISVQALTKVLKPNHLKEYEVGKTSYIWWSMMVKIQELIVRDQHASSPVGY